MDVMSTSCVWTDQFDTADSAESIVFDSMAAFISLQLGLCTSSTEQTMEEGLEPCHVTVFDGWRCLDRSKGPSGKQCYLDFVSNESSSYMTGLISKKSILSQ